MAGFYSATQPQNAAAPWPNIAPPRTLEKSVSLNHALGKEDKEPLAKDKKFSAENDNDRQTTPIDDVENVKGQPTLGRRPHRDFINKTHKNNLSEIKKGGGINFPRWRRQPLPRSEETIVDAPGGFQTSFFHNVHRMYKLHGDDGQGERIV